MGQYKQAERAEAFRLYVEEGVHDMQQLAERSNLSTTTLRTVITADVKREHHRRCREAKRLWVEKGYTDVNAVCAEVKIHRNLWFKIYDASWDAERARHVADHPTLHTTAKLLMQAAENLLSTIKSKDYADGTDINQLVKLSNAFEKFRTGEFKLESILLGIEDFTQWFRDNAAELGVTAMEARALAKVMDKYKISILEKLRLLE